MVNNHNNDKLVGTFELEAQVFKKIEELKEQGYREEDMYVVAKDGANVDTLKGTSGINVTSSDHDSNWKDKFKNLFSSDDNERSSYRNVSDDTDYDNDYGTHVESGRILLYVDQDFASSSGSFGTGSHTGTDSGLNRGGVSGSATGTGSGTEESLKLHEERLNVDKERVQTGEVNVGKHVVEEEQSIDVPVEREEVYVERRPVNEQTDSGFTDKDGLGGKDSIHVDVTEERLNVSKDDVVSEEIVVGKRKVKDTEHVSETVRREEADIDEDSNTNKSTKDKGLFNNNDRNRGL